MGVPYPDWVGFTGLARSGKDTAADLLIEYIDHDETGLRQKIAYGDALKDLAKVIGWDGIKDDRGRRLLQVLGTEVVRECIDPDYWVNKLATRAEAVWVMANEMVDKGDGETEPVIIVIPDVRFNNEAEFIKKRGGVIIHVTRPVIDDILRGKHKSEAGIDDHLVDVRLVNNGSRDLLAAKVKVLHTLLKEVWGKGGGDIALRMKADGEL